MVKKSQSQRTREKAKVSRAMIFLLLFGNDRRKAETTRDNEIKSPPPRCPLVKRLSVHISLRESQSEAQEEARGTII